MKIYKISLIVFLVLLISYSGCKSSNKEDEDTVSYGNITITSDENFAPVIDSEVYTFQKIYTGAKITALYKPEAEAMHEFLYGKSRLAIVARKLTVQEKAVLDSLALVPRVTKIFYDAIAIIVNNSNKDTLLSFDMLKNILQGNITKWKQVDPKSGLQDIRIIFDNPNSSTVSFVKEKISSELSKNSYAVKSSQAVVDYVSKNPDAIGLIGVNWVSDKDDTTSMRFLKTIKVVALKSEMPNVNPREYYQPLQAYISLKYYPLWREVYVINKEARTGLGTGFSAFIAGEKCQRIFLKSGLVPATMPIRLVEIDNQEL